MWVETRHHYGIAAVLCLRRHFAGNQWWLNFALDFYGFLLILLRIIFYNNLYYSVSPSPPKTAFTSHPYLAITPGAPFPQVTKEAIAVLL